ncbi:MAG: hypothetical protein LAT67_06580 [Balneolales bacterium]|nr:hypothetical protein [Balneolales bacterium]
MLQSAYFTPLKSAIAFFAVICLSSLILITACDSGPGATSFTNNTNLLKQITIQPGEIVFDPEQTISDTTITVLIRVETAAGETLTAPQFRVERDGSNQIFREGQLQALPNQSGQYEGSFAFTVPTNTFAELKIFAFDVFEDGKLSNTLNTRLSLTGFASEPPLIEFFNSPDEVVLPAEGDKLLRFESKVTHPQGNSLIEGVFLEIFDSSGSRIGEGPFSMLDDGNTDESGDLEAGDNIFTRVLTVSSTNQPDSFSLFSYAVDRQGLSSDTLFSTMTFVLP